MPHISKKEGKWGCPYCGTKATKKRLRKILDPATGRKDKYAGYYYSCDCYALTMNHEGEYNLKGK